MNNAFTTDFEKMVDFCFLNREDFLDSYSYINKAEWGTTFRKIFEMCFGKLSDKQEAYIDYVLDYHNTHDEYCYPVCFSEFCDNEYIEGYDRN